MRDHEFGLRHWGLLRCSDQVDVFGVETCGNIMLRPIEYEHTTC